MFYILYSTYYVYNLLLLFLTLLYHWRSLSQLDEEPLLER